MSHLAGRAQVANGMFPSRGRVDTQLARAGSRQFAQAISRASFAGRRQLSVSKNIVTAAATRERRERRAEGSKASRRPITLSDDALRHLKRMREDNGNNDLLLRVGVKSGGCSGMSYTMDFEASDNIASDDTVIDYDDFKLVTDSASMMFLLGLTLDYSNKLIGGGFIFQNPNAQSSCGCGKSFGVE